MEITPALASEADVLTDIAFAAKRHWGYPERWIDHWREMLTVTPAMIAAQETYAARIEGRVVGFVSLVRDDIVRLEHLWVLPAEMRRGVGRALFRRAQERAYALGFDTFEVESDPNASGFYERMGAERIRTNTTVLEGETRELPLFRCVATCGAPEFNRDPALVTTPYDFIADRFDADRTTLQPKELEYLSLLLDPLPPGSTILDLGCGTGRPIATHIASRGHHIVGVDGSEAMLALARIHLPAHRWIHAFIQEVDFDEAFAAAVCWDSLFHLPRQQHERVIRRIVRWLLPGGRLVVSSGGRVAEAGSGFTAPMFGHDFYYDSLTPERMVAVIEDAGCDILVSEMCDPPDDIGYDKGKWATIASRKRG